MSCEIVIYVDISSAVHAKAGIGRYAESLAQALTEQEPGEFALFYNRVPGSEVPTGLQSLPAHTVRAGYKPWRMAVLLGQALGLGFNRLVPGAELFHATEHLLPPLTGVRTVLTVHDMIFRRFPEHQKRLNYWYLNLAMPLFCRRADAIITVSNSSKRDIMADYGIPPAKITVVYEAASAAFKPQSREAVVRVRQKYALPERFLVHVGTIEPRKNLSRLIDALDLLWHNGMTIPLVVVGAKGWLYEGFFRRLERTPVRDSVYFPGYVPLADLPAFYAAATAAVMPSVYEGFGLPVLEAMACRTPVILSQAASLPEVGGGAAEYFDPYDVSDIAGAVHRVWTSATLRAEMMHGGLAQAERFTWSRAAKETLAVYDSLLTRESGASKFPSPDSRSGSLPRA